MKQELTIAVDFDGTIVKNKYPEIGNELPFAIHTLKALQAKRHRIILWTYRTGKELEAAVTFCREQGLVFYAVNKNYPEEKMNNQIGRKILADLYIDDRSIGGIPTWPDIYRMIHPEESIDYHEKPSKWKWWNKS